MTGTTILLVDDEPRVISSLTRELMEYETFDVLSAFSGNEALDILKENPETAVIISDFHMPGMDGVSFLVESQKITPDASRILLTGAAGMDVAIDAINRGQLFRFLLKPCEHENLLSAINAGLRQHQLVTSERELLSKTLNGAIRILIDILSTLNPNIFAEATRRKDLVRKLSQALNIENAWEGELAALLCQVGCVAVPQDLLNKWTRNELLNEKEQAVINAIPQVSSQLVRNIPRLENIAGAIKFQNLPFVNKDPKSKLPGGEEIPELGRLLKIILDYQKYFSKSNDPRLAYQEMLDNRGEYDPKMLSVFQVKVVNEEISSLGKNAAEIVEIQSVLGEGIEPGMIVARDILDRQGRLMASRGTIISEVLEQLLKNYLWSQRIIGPIMVGKRRYG
ncbi:MAG: HD domain-containing phosphohydrolase [Anaerolineaceae bacterium]